MAKRATVYKADPLVVSVNTGSQLAKFTAIVALFAILADATIGHGLTWENDPYWTYWITKTFLIATVFGVGTALLGIGRLRGAIITLVHTIILTVYYWTLSPIGLPSSPHWLDLEHTWLTGVPIHFGVIYLGYLTALWVWRNRPRSLISSKSLGLQALLYGLAIVIIAGVLSNLALGEFAGVTWFVTRLLITVTFLILWWGAVGRTLISAIIGSVVLTQVWAAYSQYLSPVGLPHTPLRLFSQSPPPATVHWLDYNQLWLISVPIYLVSMLGLLSLASLGRRPRELWRPAIVWAVIIAAVVLLTALLIPPKSQGEKANISASGNVLVEKGNYYGNNFTDGSGKISISAVDMGGRVSPLPPNDKVDINAEVQSGGHSFRVVAKDPMIDDPMGKFTTWWGVGLGVEHHGNSGIGPNKLPTIKSKLAVFAMGDVFMDGKLVAAGTSIHAMTAEKGLASNHHLELDVGDSRVTGLPNIPSGHLRILWNNYQGHIPGESEAARYIGGGLVLLALLIGGLIATGKAAEYKGTVVR
jgi:hypothetical protein